MNDASVMKGGWSDKVTAVCIGGPFDGQRRAERGPRFEYAERPPMTPVYAAAEACKPIEYKKGLYYAEEFCGVVVWVHQPMTPQQVMARLVEQYALPPVVRNTSRARV